MNSKNFKKIYIIILNWNNFSDTFECINSLNKINVAKDNFQIVVVDNESRDTKIKKYFPFVKLFTNEKNEGFATSNNIAINYCLKQDDCRYIMILNNDTVVECNFMEYLLDYLDKNPKSVVGPKILYFSKKDTVQTVGGKIFMGGVRLIGKNKKSSEFYKKINPDILSGTCFMTKKENFLDIGLFDKNYFAYFEDVDWCLSARKKNYELAVIPKSIIYHKHSQSSKGTFLKTYLISRNSIYFAKKNFNGLKKYLFIFNGIIIGFFVNLCKYKNIYFLESFVRGIKDGFKGIVILKN